MDMGGREPRANASIPAADRVICRNALLLQSAFRNSRADSHGYVPLQQEERQQRECCESRSIHRAYRHVSKEGRRPRCALVWKPPCLEWLRSRQILEPSRSEREKERRRVQRVRRDLSSELSRDQQMELVKVVIEQVCAGKPYQVAIHSPKAVLGKRPAIPS